LSCLFVSQFIKSCLLIIKLIVDVFVLVNQFFADPVIVLKYVCLSIDVWKGSKNPAFAILKIDYKSYVLNTLKIDQVTFVTKSKLLQLKRIHLDAFPWLKEVEFSEKSNTRLTPRDILKTVEFISFPVIFLPLGCITPFIMLFKILELIILTNHTITFISFNENTYMFFYFAKTTKWTHPLM